MTTTKLDLAFLLDVAAYAAQKHRDQQRKDSHATPYINHPLQVARTLAVEGGVEDIELIAAALLHDTVEDTETSFDELRSKFGESVSELVSEVTDDKSLKKEERKRLQIEHAPHRSDRAKLLKIADKTCNVRDLDARHPVGWDAARKRQYVQWAIDVVEGCRGVNASLERAFDQAAEQATQRIEQS